MLTTPRGRPIGKVQRPEFRVGKSVPLFRSKLLPKCPAVYLIRCRASEETYIGGTVDFSRRVGVHRAALKSGTNLPILQACYDRNKKSDFTVEVLEYCEAGNVAARENSWIGEVHPSLNRQVPHFPLGTEKTKIQVTLGPGVPDANLIRRFQDGVEVPPVYVPVRGQFIAQTLRQASTEAAVAGYDRFVFKNETHHVRLLDRVPQTP